MFSTRSFFNAGAIARLSMHIAFDIMKGKWDVTASGQDCHLTSASIIFKTSSEVAGLEKFSLD